MRVSYRISFPGGKDFEQHESIFEADSNDFIDSIAFHDLNPLQRVQLMNSLLMVNGLLFLRAEGYIDKDEYEKRKVRIFSLMQENVKGALTEVLTNGNSSKTS
jgi:hypothetical protein